MRPYIWVMETVGVGFLKREREYHARVYEWYDLWYLNHLCGDGGASNSNTPPSERGEISKFV